MEFRTVIERRGQIRTLELFPGHFTNRPVTIRLHFARWGWGAFNDFMGNLGKVEELKRDEGARDAISELKSLIRSRLIENNSGGVTQKISGSLSGRILEMLIYGEEQKSAMGLEIGKIKNALSDSPNQVKNGKNWKEKKSKEKKKEIIENWKIKKLWVAIGTYKGNR